MKREHLIESIIAAVGVGMTAIGLLYSFSGGIIKNLSSLRASNAMSVGLTRANSPSLSNGSGTIVDSKGVVWEYYNVSNYSQGHITLNHQGYFGVSATSPYGITGTTDITANFIAGQNSELWLLKSVDGLTWSENSILESGSAVTSANNWRYVRFYNYSTDASSISVNSILMNYSCSGYSSTEDIDSAKASNVISVSSNLTYTAEYYDISPNSIGGEAVSFTKSDNIKSEIVIGFGETYTVGNIQNAKVEFDMKTSNINYGKTMQLMMNSSGVGSSIDSSKHNAYKCINIQDDWYHIEVPITAFVSTISGYGSKDIPAKDIETKQVNGIKINAGTCVIDNLRLDTSACELGIFNNPDYKPSVNEFFWLKVAWVGKLYPEQVTMTFSDNTLARHISITDQNLKNGSPFYIQLLGSGSVTVTCTVVSGYNRAVQVIQHAITVK